MHAADCIVIPRWLIPVEPAGQVLEEHAVVVGNGRIVALVPAAEAVSSFAAEKVIERPDHVLIPGLINAHTHAAMTLFRGLADDLPLQEWLEDHVWPAEARWVDSNFVRDGTDLAVFEMIRSGTTCFNDMYYFPDTVAQVAAERNLRACVGMIVIEMKTAWAENFEEYLTKGIKVHDRYREHPLISTAFAPHSTYAVGDNALQRVSALADELDVPIHMHLHETAAEVQQSVDQFGQRPIERLAAIGVLNPQLAAVHMTQLNHEEIMLVAEHGVSVVHCPESNMKLGSGFCPVAELLAAGVNVALGTDGAASNNDLDMLGEMRSAALLAKGVAGNPEAVKAEDALAMATINGAHALGLGESIGSLVVGKWADMVCLNLAAPATQPVHHALSQVVYSASRDQVSDVWVAGRPLLRDGEFSAPDAPAVFKRAAAWRDRLDARDE
ncbi:MAG: TRZ/ATZ family hydrolase [Pseudomonadota bacterium]|nr:TRZ/ATZ family hydrolase [Pseudomonadota bacterium]